MVMMRRLSMLRMARVVSVVAAVGIVATLLAVNSAGGGAYDNDVAKTTSEFDAETRTLALPEDMAWPDEGPLWMFADADVEVDSLRFEDGFGALAADTYYLCAWETAWVVDPAGQEESLRRVSDFKQTHAWRSSWDDVGRRLLDERLAVARDGSPDAFVSDVVDNCPAAMVQAVRDSDRAA